MDWNPNKVEESLQTVFEKATTVGQGAINWYATSKKSKKWWAQTIRISSIVLGAIAALLPTIGDMLSKDGMPGIPGGWTTICLGQQERFYYLINTSAFHQPGCGI